MHSEVISKCNIFKLHHIFKDKQPNVLPTLLELFNWYSHIGRTRVLKSQSNLNK